MRKSLILFLPILAFFSSLISACGGDHEASKQGTNIIGFGFMGGVISTLLVIAFIFLIILLSKNFKIMKGGKK